MDEQRGLSNSGPFLLYVVRNSKNAYVIRNDRCVLPERKMRSFINERTTSHRNQCNVSDTPYYRSEILLTIV